MRKADVLAYFGGSESEVARRLGIGRASVNAWGPVVPEMRAYKIESITNGMLKVDPTVYKRGSARQQAIRARARRERRPDSPRLPA